MCVCEGVCIALDSSFVCFLSRIAMSMNCKRNSYLPLLAAHETQLTYIVHNQEGPISQNFVAQ